RAQLAERVVQRVKDAEEEDGGAGDAGRDVAQHIQLGPPGPAVAVAQPHGHAAGLERRTHRAPDIHDGRAAPAALLVPAGGPAASPFSSSALRMRCTSTPITPDPSP